MVCKERCEETRKGHGEGIEPGNGNGFIREQMFKEFLLFLT